MIWTLDLISRTFLPFMTVLTYMAFIVWSLGPAQLFMNFLTFMTSLIFIACMIFQAWPIRPSRSDLHNFYTFLLILQSSALVSLFKANVTLNNSIGIQELSLSKDFQCICKSVISQYLFCKANIYQYCL